MDEREYSKREIDTFQKAIIIRLDDHSTQLGKVLEQTTKTNGRATALEIWSKEAQKIIEQLAIDSRKFKNDRIRIYTFISVLIVVGATVGYLYYNLIDLKISSDINVAVAPAVSSAFDSRFSKEEVINQ